MTEREAILIVNAKVVTLDERDTILEDGAIAVIGNQIAAVGPTPEIRKQYGDRAAEVIDAGGGLVMPGLVNAHTHAADTLFRGLVEDLPLEPWLDKLWIAERSTLTPETVRLGSQLAFAEMIRSGTTTALDMFWFPEASAQAAVEAGFRLVSGPIFFDFDGPDGMAAEDRYEQAKGFLTEYKDHPLIGSCVLPHGGYTVSPEYLEQAFALAEEFDALFHTHASETQTEVATVQERYGASPIGHLEALGLLSPRTVLAHCVHVTEEEIDLLAQRETAVAHNPLSNLKLGSGIAPIPAMLAAGVCVALGTDGPVSSNDLDMWTAMRFASLQQKGIQRDPTLMKADETVHMATRAGAQALNLDDRIGSLEVGKRADLIVVELDSPHLAPLFDIYPHLAYTVGRDDVATVMIEGQVVMRDRQLLTIDEQQVLAEVRALTGQIAATIAE